MSVNTAANPKRPHPSRPKTHNRSLSHTKLLGKIASSSSAATLRPDLSRSKSTDGLSKTRPSSTALKRNNKSFTKVVALQPLTKTSSNQSLKSNKSNTSLKGLGSYTGGMGLKSSARKGKAILRLNDDDAEYEDLDEPPAASAASAAPVPERFDSEETISTMRSNSDQNIPSLYEQINRIVPDPSPSVNEVSRPKLEVLPESNANEGNTETAERITTSAQSSAEDLSQAANLYGGSLLLSQSTGLVRKIDPLNAKRAEVLPNQQINLHNNNNGGSNNQNSVSGISFKANPIESARNVAEPVTTNQNAIQKSSYQPGQTIFSNLQRTNNRYHTSDKAQRHADVSRGGNGEALPSAKLPGYSHNGPNNYNEFLRSSSSSSDLHPAASKNIETRTQQKLWLQRESSLMDVANMNPSKAGNFSSLSLNNLMFAHSYGQSHGSMRDLQNNGHSFMGSHGFSASIGPMTPITPGPSSEFVQNGYNQYAPPSPEGSVSTNNGLQSFVQGANQNSIQSRTEFERLNREYLNVRRHLNPVGGSLDRLESLQNGDIHIEKRSNKTNLAGNSFKDFISASEEEREKDVAAKIGRMWQEAVFSTLTSHRPNNARMSSFGSQNQFARQVQSAKSASSSQFHA
ncbi:uncharacterized protein LODBEIA_P26260 [Lodderomyces beijingensis]|uniref:TORC1 subunit TCO89 n=1 Tax=Lodderomyces beijingensis TaxID=1775926 RepID=A0ABP0ZQD0_9ASCO